MGPTSSVFIRSLRFNFFLNTHEKVSLFLSEPYSQTNLLIFYKYFKLRKTCNLWKKQNTYILKNNLLALKGALYQATTMWKIKTLRMNLIQGTAAKIPFSIFSIWMKWLPSNAGVFGESTCHFFGCFFLLFSWNNRSHKYYSHILNQKYDQVALKCKIIWNDCIFNTYFYLSYPPS